MSLVIEEVRGALARKEWNGYLDQHEHSTVFHRYEWGEAVVATYGGEYIYIVAKEEGSIRGVLPLGRSKSFLFGDYLCSVPFGVYGGIVADTEDIAQQLDSYACRLAENMNVDYLEVRNQQGTGRGTPGRDIYVTFRKPILEGAENNLKAIPRKQRAVVRKGINLGLSFSITKDVDTFYKLYSESVRNLGTPVFSKDLFRNILRFFPDQSFILTIFDKDNPVCSVLTLSYKKEIIPYYGGGGHLARALHGNDFMYWKLMEWAANSGFTSFDFGRSKVGTGSFSFKKNWGFESTPLAYEYFLVRKQSVPDKSPLNPKIKPLIEVWKRMPLSLTNTIGPFVSKSLG
ncbi:FemAB family XrtA/PEP-CTERM system-associated protein [Aestuariirhabdus litorea]|uniref:FemAB family PEP-CTERM system-associated protein n=1 Tax=Aestuariirhabdus litorea TaxID=2528527 RepID=A0A3P3VSY3_9GAMM|nr:FemAB family XrtA/PEP-CTERM system-associated protein [Aestuariirhabdus litorea]RRJ84589.1 FemAB family PEP-CTERM system-associated protein [Aestuariirhabdus litorea]RWW97815.1 FemAB family PEP-CTERM system-associated protein [Endozoicomonadaceae bacterium GTF-13]